MNSQVYPIMIGYTRLDLDSMTGGATPLSDAEVAKVSQVFDREDMAFISEAVEDAVLSVIKARIPDKEEA